jgi:hypothetical protein
LCGRSSQPGDRSVALCARSRCSADQRVAQPKIACGRLGLRAITISTVMHIRVSLSHSFSSEIIATRIVVSVYMYSNIFNENFRAAHVTQREMIK